MKTVPEEAFNEFVAKYPRTLRREAFRIGEPPQMHLIDATLTYPQSVVARYTMNDGKASDWAIDAAMALPKENGQ